MAQQLYISKAFHAELRASGLVDEQIARSEAETKTDQAEIHKLLNWSPPRPRARNSLGDCLVYPCIEPGAIEPYAWRVKPTHPRSDSKGVRKYESPKGSGVIHYFPPLSRSKYRGLTVVVWSEGEKKALLLDQLGYCTVGLTGVWCAHDVEERRASGRYVLHPRLLKHIAIAGREHVVCFDSDAREKPGVMHAANVLARMLLDAGATVVKLALPPGVAE